MKFFGLALLAVLLSPAIKAQTPAATVPSFTFKTTANASFSPADLAINKPLFFVFFDVSCDHCQHAIEYLGKHPQDFKKAAVYLISLDDFTKMTAFLKKHGGNLVAQKNTTLLRDANNEFIQKFGPRKYPSLFLYSAQKKLIRYEDDEKRLPDFARQISAAN